MARPRTDIRPKLVRAARERFLVEGVDGASLRDIARDAGTNIGMVYYYFPTKDDLFVAVVEEVYAPLSEAVAKAFDGEEALEVKVERFYARMAAMSDDEVTVLRLLIRELLVSSERRKLMLARFMRGHIPTMLGAMMQAQARGQIDARYYPPVVGISVLVLGILPQIIYRLVRPTLPAIIKPPPPEEIAKMLATVVLEGAQPRAHPPAQPRHAPAHAPAQPPTSAAPTAPSRDETPHAPPRTSPRTRRAPAARKRDPAPRRR